jgi:hypothetical protein
MGFASATPTSQAKTAYPSNAAPTIGANFGQLIAQIEQFLKGLIGLNRSPLNQSSTPSTINQAESNANGRITPPSGFGPTTISVPTSSTSTTTSSTTSPSSTTISLQPTSTQAPTQGPSGSVGVTSTSTTTINSVSQVAADSVQGLNSSLLTQVSKPTIHVDASNANVITVASTFSGGRQPYTVSVLTSGTSAGCPTGTSLYQASVSGTGNISVSYNVTALYPPTTPEFYCVKVVDSKGSSNISNSIGRVILVLPGPGLLTPIIASNQIVLSNRQGISTGQNFQQMLYFDPQNYGTYEAPDLGNIRFYISNASAIRANELYSWCESGCSSSASNSVFWIKLPAGINANSNVILNITFLPVSVEYDGVYAGEAPQLSCPNSNTMVCGGTYAKYDNGNSVFNFYDNFAGNSLNPSKWTVVTPSSYYVGNGLELTGVSGSGLGQFFASSKVSFNIANSNVIVDAYRLATSCPWFGFDVSDSWENGGVLFYDAGTGNCAWAMVNSLNSQIKSSTGENTNTWYIQGGAEVAIPTFNWTTYEYVNYTKIASSPPNYFYHAGPIDLADGGGTGTMQWIRARSYPPNGVMPSEYFPVQYQLTRPTISASRMGGANVLVRSSFSGGIAPYAVKIFTSTTSSGCQNAGNVLYSGTVLTTQGTINISDTVISLYPSNTASYFCVGVSDGDGHSLTSNAMGFITVTSSPAMTILALKESNSSYGGVLSLNRTQIYTSVALPPYKVAWYSGPSSGSCNSDTALAANSTVFATANSLQYADLLVYPTNSPTYYCASVSAANNGYNMTLGPANVAVANPQNSTGAFYLPPAVNGCSYGSIYNTYLGTSQPCQTIQIAAIEGALGGSNGILANYLGANDTNDPIAGMFNTYYNKSSVEAVAVNCRGQSSFPCLAIFYFNSTANSPVNLVAGPDMSD